MSSRSLFWILLLAALGAATWALRDQPLLQAWLSSALRSPAAAPAAATLRRCQGVGGIVYTDGECPRGTQAQRVERGSLTVLPAPAQPAAPAAASAVAPLRRLAGPDDSAAQRERVLEQALHR